MIVVVAAVKGGVGKTTSSIYLAALGANRRPATIVDADPQAAAAEWVEFSDDERLEKVNVIEAPTDRLLSRALDRLGGEDLVVVDTPPAHDRLLGKIVERADVVLIPTRVGGIEAPRVEAVLAMVPAGTPVGLVIASARTFTRDYQDALAAYAEARVPVWGTIPERVGIAAGPARPLFEDGLEAYKKVWRRVQTAARSGG
ncbi:MAG: AAA family ATPase [Micromonosporaceae bacterium]|nr:AAA family ATPase [Micromonosporaceae bacterium]